MSTAQLLRAIVVDDDPFSRAQVEMELQRHGHSVSLVAQCTSGGEGLRAVADHRPDLVLLDVRMPDMDGFEMLDACRMRDFGVVFITRFDQYAIRAFRYSAIDYLLKPIKSADFAQAIGHAIAHRERLPGRLDRLLQQRPDTRPPGTLVIVTRHGDRHLATQEIVHCEADRNYTWFHLRNGEKLLSSHPLNTYEEFLSEQQFLRVHRSHMVNLAHVVNISTEGVIMLSNGAMVEISRRRKEEVMRILGA